MQAGARAGWSQTTVEPARAARLSAGSDDFGLTADARLVASEAALAVLRTGDIDYCEVVPFDD